MATPRKTTAKKATAKKATTRKRADSRRPEPAAFAAELYTNPDPGGIKTDAGGRPMTDKGGRPLTKD